MRKPRRLPPELLAPYVWELPEAYHGVWGARGAGEPQQRIQWSKLFGNTNPVEVEVGFGKGLFLVSSGMARPDTNFFGIEILRKYQLFTANRLAVRELKNVITCCGDAKLVLRDFIPPASVQAVHIFFPDPWWKARHKKRMLFTSEFAGIVQNVLVPGGQLHFVTDVGDYFEMVSRLLAALPGLESLPPPKQNVPQHDMDYLTNFERKFRKEGRTIHRGLYARRDA